MIVYPVSTGKNPPGVGNDSTNNFNTSAALPPDGPHNETGNQHLAAVNNTSTSMAARSYFSQYNPHTSSFMQSQFGAA